jgi:hypothetical protein
MREKTERKKYFLLDRMRKIVFERKFMFSILRKLPPLPSE